MTSEPAGSILELSGISKTFGSTKVLDSVAMAVLPGEVHALTGQNGSGKSTLIKILAGYHHPDRGGQLRINGEPLQLPVRPGRAASVGLCFLHQDLALVPSLSVAENILIGRGFRTGPGWRIQWRAERELIAELLEEFHVAASPETLVSRVGEIDRAIVAILRALEQARVVGHRAVIVLDEPTAFLPRREVGRVFDAIRSAVAKGAGAIFVSHRLDEVKSISDRITVLRDGRRVDTVETAAVSEQDIVHMMLGRDLEALYPEATASAEDAVALRVTGIGGNQVRGLDLDLHRGEILGVTGLLGMGQDELPYLLAGAAQSGAGSVESSSGPIPRGSPRDALKHGVVLLPADRKTQSGLQEATVGENLSLPVLRRYWRAGRLAHRAERAAAVELLNRFHVQPADPGRVLASLSGGNQQKALLAKWMQMRPSVLILHEPTQGVDIGARAQVFAYLREIADSGTAILMCSSEYDDLAHLCDRVLVLRNGQVAGNLHGTALTEDSILRTLYLAAEAA